MWAERLGVQVRRVQIRAMRTKWASCSTNGTLTLNADVLKLPPDLVDYVLCHDLLHLKLPDHGKGFRASIGCYLPDGCPSKFCGLLRFRGLVSGFANRMESPRMIGGWTPRRLGGWG
jgi:predicted metal-dependent hydrolase